MWMIKTNMKILAAYLRLPKVQEQELIPLCPKRAMETADVRTLSTKPIDSSFPIGKINF
jgi:hypothetical protein